jgi:hypothetical protein
VIGGCTPDFFGGSPQTPRPLAHFSPLDIRFRFNSGNVGFSCVQCTAFPVQLGEDGWALCHPAERSEKRPKRSGNGARFLSGLAVASSAGCRSSRAGLIESSAAIAAGCDLGVSSSGSPRRPGLVRPDWDAI